MRFELTQTFTHPAAEVDAAYANVDLYPTLVGLPNLGGIEVLDHAQRGDTVENAIRFAFVGDLPSAVTAILDPAKLTWIQRSTHDLVAHTCRFTLVPDHYPERLKASGTIRIVDSPGGCRRIVAGELKVSALLVAGKVEHAIVNGLTEYFAAEAPAVDRFLDA